MSQRTYLDNAATSWPKPESVYAAVEDAMRRLGAPAGRGTYREAADVERLIERTRSRVSELLNARQPHEVVFGFNGTDVLNMAIQGSVAPGDHVITSVVEHNSVLRPLRYLEEHGGVRVTRIACDAQGYIDPDEVRQAIRADTRLIVLLHASNVTGAVQPIEAVGRIAADHAVPFLVDAAQSLGHLAIDVQQLGATMLAAPGHKGLLGPLGTGVLHVRESYADRLRPWRCGGTGTQSDRDVQPDSLPEKFEAGNPNVPGLAGLGAGVEYLLRHSIDALARHEATLTAQLLDGLLDIEAVTVHGPGSGSPRVGVVSLSIAGYDPREVAALLDSTHTIQVRAGIHCAPLMHASLGTVAQGGTVRLSFGPLNTSDEVQLALAAVREIAELAVLD